MLKKSFMNEIAIYMALFLSIVWFQFCGTNCCRVFDKGELLDLLASLLNMMENCELFCFVNSKF